MWPNETARKLRKIPFLSPSGRSLRDQNPEKLKENLAFQATFECNSPVRHGWIYPASPNGRIALQTPQISHFLTLTWTLTWTLAETSKNRLARLFDSLILVWISVIFWVEEIIHCGFWDDTPHREEEPHEREGLWSKRASRPSNANNTLLSLCQRHGNYSVRDSSRKIQSRKVFSYSFIPIFGTTTGGEGFFRGGRDVWWSLGKVNDGGDVWKIDDWLSHSRI